MTNVHGPQPRGPGLDEDQREQLGVFEAADSVTQWQIGELRALRMQGNPVQQQRIDRLLEKQRQRDAEQKRKQDSGKQGDQQSGGSLFDSVARGAPQDRWPA